MIRLARYARGEWTAVVLIGIGLTIAAAFLVGPYCLVIAFLTVAALGFFRDPDRRCEAGDNDIVSPADGKIVELKRTESDDEFLKGPAYKIAIFMSLFDVHVNRAPCDAVVKFVRRHKGTYRNAATDEASASNARCVIGLESGGRPIVLTQIAGLIARGIVCDCREGTQLTRGQRFGMIKLGSRVELLLPDPDSFQPLVEVGQKVKAGSTVLGRYTL